MKQLGRDDIPDLVEGKVSVFVFFVKHPQKFFLYTNGVKKPSKTAKLQVADSKDFLDRYVDEMNKGYVFGLSPGELLDEAGNRFIVKEPNAVAEVFEDLPPTVSAEIPLDWFFVESKSDSEAENDISGNQKAPQPRGSAGLLVQEYLRENPDGNLAGLREWAARQYGASSFDRNGKKFLRWVDYQEELQEIPEKTLSNQLYELRKNQK